jgi:hypothetical protein
MIRPFFLQSPSLFNKEGETESEGERKIFKFSSYKFLYEQVQQKFPLSRAAVKILHSFEAGRIKKLAFVKTFSIIKM